MKIKLFLLVFFVLVFIVTQRGYITADTSNSSVSVLVLYDSNKVYNYFDSKLSLNNASITYIKLSSDLSVNLNNYDVIIITSTDEISMNDATEDELLQFTENSNHVVFIFSQNIDDLSDEFRDKMQINNIEDQYGNSTSSWNIQLTDNYYSYNTSELFNYTGSLLEVETDANIIANVIAGDFSNDTVNYPIPILFNSSKIYTSPINVVEKNNEGLMLSQAATLNFVDSLLIGIVEDETENIYIQNSKQNTNSDINSDLSTDASTVDSSINDTVASNTIDQGNKPSTQLNQPIFLFLSFLFLIAMLFYRKISDLLKWLYEKTLGMVFVVGAYFTIHKRNLTHNEVLYNSYRNDILNYLNHVGQYGAHLREIKSRFDLGTGTLLWHLQMLEDYGMVDVYSIGRSKVYILPDHVIKFNPKLKELELKLQSEKSIIILEYLKEYNEGSIRSLSEKTGIPRKTILRILRKLSSYGILEILDDGTFKIIDKDAINKLNESNRLRKVNHETNNVRVNILE